MNDNYRTVYRGGEGILIEKRSRFIATVRPVASEEEAVSFIDEMKKKYWDARHNCYAFTAGENREYTRCSDDGEPSGTAGRPMLEVLLGEGLYNTAVVVTRYFGGVLLGTGGLVRAYTGAVQEGLKASTLITRTRGVQLRINTDYTDFGRIQYITAERHIPVTDTEYTDQVTMHVIVANEEEAAFRKAVTEATGAKAMVEKEKDLWFAVVDGKAEIFS
ncbi:MAG: YigZ family protein [Blautia sp.]|nr:YigZ family protein [Blautia sp.]